MKRESFVFYRSFAEAVKNMDKETKADFLDALCAYALDGEETDCEGIVAAFMSLVKPQIDANNQRYENGKRGGRPKNQEKTEEKPNENQTETKTKPKQNQTETKAEPNVNVNENDKEKVSPIGDTKKKSPAPKKNVYGEFQNVMLSADDLERLKAKFPDDLDSRIEKLSAYIASTGKKYKDHRATIMNWARRDEEQGKGRDRPKRSYHRPDDDIYSDDIYEVL